MMSRQRSLSRLNWIEEDRLREEKITVIGRMEEEFRKAMNSINPDVKFTTEAAQDFPNFRLQTLDTEIWQEADGTIRHSYFQRE